MVEKAKLCLLPQPKELAIQAGTFELNGDTLLVLPAAAGDDVLFAVRQLRDEIGRAAGLDLKVMKQFRPHRRDNVVLFVCGQKQAETFGVKPTETAAPQVMADQSYGLTITPEATTLYAANPTGLFYAVQTLRQVVRLQGTHLPALAVHDWPRLVYRGLMLDVSRGKVPTLATLKELVEVLSSYKLNVLQLYTEHTFQFARHPKIGAGCGSLSSDDILALDEHCRRRHVELMPNLQSFGHFRNTLALPEYQHLAETGLLWTLSPALEESYTLLSELYADMLPSFISTTFNVGCDETYDLGMGASKAQAEAEAGAGARAMGIGRVYLNHILRVRELAARYGRRIQVWGDILLHHPELISELPEDVTLLDWCYEAADEYPTVRTFGASGRTFWVCPGTSSWNTLFPRLYNANVNIRNLVRDGVAAGALGMLNTDWGDYGHYQPLGLSWYGYLFGAAQGWSGGTTSDEEFEAAFGPLFFGPQHERILAAVHQLARTNTLPGLPRPNRSHTVLALFDEPLTGETIDGLPPQTLTEMRALAEKAATTFDAVAPGHPQELTLREMALTARLIAYAARKVTLSQGIRQALRDASLDAARITGYVHSLKVLDAELETLRAEFEELWLARARRSEVRVALGYYASLRARYRAVITWLEQQRQALLQGQPVDADLTTYDRGGHLVLWQEAERLFRQLSALA